MQNLFSLAEQVLGSDSIETKIQVTQNAWDLLESGQLSFDTESDPLPIERVRMPSRPELVPPKKVPKRRLNTPAGMIAFVHAIAHIEFNAIHLAWDMLYRFRGLPELFYRNWLQVAHDEKRHFCMLRARLTALGSDYGELPAHMGLWSMAVKTEHDLIARLALIPRYLEARGLDVTPAMLDKLYAIGDQDTAAILEVILRDEVTHVKYGTDWLHHACVQAGFEPDAAYFEQLDQFMAGELRGPLNRPLRREAGFSEFELNQLESRIRS